MRINSPGTHDAPAATSSRKQPGALVWPFVTVVFACGLTAVGWAIGELSSGSLGWQWLILAGLTWVSAAFSLKVPHVAITVSISETFVFMILLLFGGPAATATVAVDGLITSLHRRNLQPRRLLFNFAEPAISASVASAAFYWSAGVPPLAQAPATLGALLGPTLLMACVYFLVNSGLTAVAVAAESGGSPYRLWREHFLWLSMNYFGGASIALLLALNTREVTVSSLMAVVPLLALLYVAFKSWIRRVDEATHHLSQLNRLHLATVESLSMAIDAKDQVTHGHIRRVQKYALELARAMGISNDTELKALEAAALLHDMGKVAVPDHILNKPGRLTPAEYEKMKLHSVIGADILSAVEFPFPVVPIVRHHHENWDGTGYPDGLTATAIPIGARILSVIDCYDALTSDRPYRPALTRDQAMEIVHERRGRMYDPAIVDAFDTIVDHLPTIDDSGGLRTEALERISRMAAEPPDDDRRTRSVADSTLSERILQLCDLSEVMAGHATLEDIANVLGRHLQRLVPASLVVFYLKDQERDLLKAAYAVGPGEHLVHGLEIPVGDGLSGWVAVNGRSIRNSHPALDFGDRLASLPTPPQSTLSTALVGTDHSLGVVSLYATEPAAFTLDHQHVLELVARPIAAALGRGRRFDVERASNFTDPDTGLPNHNYLAQLLTTHGFSDSLLMHSLGVLSIEWDDVAADRRVLRTLGDAVRNAVRVTDLTFRHGEKQLVVLIPDCTAEIGSTVAERVTTSVGAALAGHTVVNAGLAYAPADGDTLTELVQAAQSRMQRHRAQLLTLIPRPLEAGDVAGGQRALSA